MRLSSFSGFAKDTVALGRARTKGRFAKQSVALISATSHGRAPASERCVQLVFSAGTGSRMRVSNLIRLLMDRLNKTKNWVVALKCLTLIHNGLRNSEFIFQDQMTFYPTQGGRNYLNFSKFKDRSSLIAWEASYWIRWYARFLEQRILTCRTLGHFLDSEWSHNEPSSVELCGLENDRLFREISALNDLLQEICECPILGSATSNELVKDASRLVIRDSFITQQEVKSRLREVCYRLDNLSKLEISRFVQLCEKLSMESVRLIHVTETCLAQNLLDSHQFSEKITEYELLLMKASLKAT